MRVPPVVPFVNIIIIGHLGLEPKTGGERWNIFLPGPLNWLYFMARGAPLLVKALGVVLDG